MFSLETVSVLKLVKMFTNVGNSSTRARNKSPFKLGMPLVVQLKHVSSFVRSFYMF